MPSVRVDAAHILQAVLEDKVFFGELKKQIPEKDLPFLNMLILTALRHLIPLNTVLAQFIRKKIAHKNRLAHYLLVLATAEILYMNTAPYAVINETVGAIRRTTDKFLANMANAVLRQIAAQKNDLWQQAEKISPLPPTFTEILAGYTADETAQIAQSVYQIPPLDITVKANPTASAEKFGAQILPNGTLRLPENTKITALSDFEKSAWVQDVAAGFPVQLLGDIKGLKAVDLCAAPGGKTAQLAAAGAHVQAIDISASRLQTLQENMQRLNFTDVEIINADALQFLQSTDEQFDVILLDAPCSATGTFRRHPEVLHIKTAADVAAQVQLQSRLLEACGRVLRIGGVLMYSVCSICKKEGEEQIAAFLQNHQNFKIVPLKMTALETHGRWQQNMVTPDGTLRTLPFYEAQKGGMDSFFICKMQRII